MNVLYDYAMRFVGLPYRWGGSNPIGGFDCSGFVQELLASIAMDPPGDQTAQSLHDYFLANGGASGVIGFGAVGFYGKSDKEISHVVFFLNEWQIIGANGGGSGVTTPASADRQNAFIKVRPADWRKDLVKVIMPKYPPGLI